ncbi:hypothetical protein SMSP2_02947 [Limihaloglobus sulfuriphilus]|uniref:DUF4139 domain-containing protein n=1 Tax=Limihaloglobus sulfuriphilus TaxID=1851148 RepID=A0A1Q2MJC6_9BACT|nr:DUF4139 domain-containing protein [Limihaloglobus sulfuriphilus]AQQ72557.1 hypothetical protein SMSP2_02947 [Limihaloglobus sulfuriphilus]
MRKTILFLAITAICLPAYSEEILKEDILKVALFKNGMGFFVSQVDVPAGADSVIIRPQVVPSLGSCWLSSGGGLMLKSAVASEVDIHETEQAVSLMQLLSGNVGKTATIRYGEEQVVVGEIQLVPKIEPQPPIRPYEPGKADNGRNRRPWYSEPQMMLVKTEQGLTAINPQQVWAVDFSDADISSDAIITTSGVELKVTFKDNTSGGKLGLCYLAKGITWSPSYIFDITEDKARFTAKGLVINEAADLEGVELLLATGFPNIQFADTYSPLGMKYSLSDFLNQLAGSGSDESRRLARGMGGNVMMQKAAFDMAESAAPAAPDYGTAAQGISNEDLFFYPVDSVTLKTDETGYYPLFTEELEYKHIYTWKVDQPEPVQRYNRGDDSSKEEIWHCIRFDNTTGMPLTTSPAQIVKNDLILGQDTLNYTPIGQEATVKITQALDIKAEKLDYESRREREVKTFYGNKYDLITFECKLSVTNHKAEDVSLEIERTFIGRVIDKSHKETKEKVSTPLGSVNPRTNVTWNLDVKAGETAEITCQYQAYAYRDNIY